jgi:UDP:flavonoid glycosyltransferase YjiC (YdhE family)
MARIALVWELGSNFGHISGFAPIAAELCKRGHEVVAVLANIHDAPRFLPREVQLLPAPRAVVSKPPEGKRSPKPPTPHTYCDLLTLHGYREAKELSTLVRSWRALFTLVRPDAVLYESAPTAMLASRGLGFAKIGFGSGYSIPPRIAPLPPLLPHLALPFVELEKRERAMVGVINEALAQNSIAPIQAMRDTFELDKTLIKSVPELDQYGARTDVEYVGPAYTLDTGGAVEFPDGAGPKVFLYLRPLLPSTLESVVQDLVRAPFRAIAVLPTASNEQIARLRLPHVKASTQPARLERVTQTADLAVCHSAVGTGAAFLFAGVPLLLLPTSLEQEMSAKRIAEAGAGLVPPPNQPASYPALMQRVLTEPSYRESAQRLAHKYGVGGEQSRVRDVCDRVEASIAQRARA